MPDNPEKSNSLVRANLRSGRTQQKRRTYQAVLQAALELSDAGHTPSLLEIAEKAMVSRATVYRYFTSAEAIVSEARFGRAILPLEKIVTPDMGVEDAIGHATEALNRVLLEDERGVHLVEGAFIQIWLNNDEEARLTRVGRRMSYIDPILSRLADVLNEEQLARLRVALSAVLGTQPLIAMRDIAGASVPETLAASVWAAKALVRQAVAEARLARK